MKTRRGIWMPAPGRGEGRRTLPSALRAATSLGEGGFGECAGFEGKDATVLALRQKKARGEKLEPWERDFWRRNAGICRIRPRLSAAEEEEKPEPEG